MNCVPPIETSIDDMAPTKVLADVWRNFSRFPRSRAPTGFAEGILGILEGGHSVAGKKEEWMYETTGMLLDDFEFQR